MATKYTILVQGEETAVRARKDAAIAYGENHHADTGFEVRTDSGRVVASRPATAPVANDTQDYTERLAEERDEMHVLLESPAEVVIPALVEAEEGEDGLSVIGNVIVGRKWARLENDEGDLLVYLRNDSYEMLNERFATDTIKMGRKWHYIYDEEGQMIAEIAADHLADASAMLVALRAGKTSYRLTKQAL